jgi:hypothetical protein
MSQVKAQAAFFEAIGQLVISMDKCYTTRDGIPVRILCVDRKDRQSVVGLLTLSTGLDCAEVCVESWYPNGVYHCDKSPSSMDLVEVSQYAHFKTDDPVLALLSDETRIRAHFAGLDANGGPKMWKDGRTSLTAYGPEDTISVISCEPYLKT